MAGLLGCPVPGNCRGDCWSPEMYPHPGHEAQNVPQETWKQRGLGGVPGPLGGHPVSAPRVALDVVDVPMRSLTGLPTTRLPPEDGALEKALLWDLSSSLKGDKNL